MRAFGGYGLRPIEPLDESQILNWRNSARVRKWMLNRERISRDTHEAWFQRRLGETPASGLVLEYEGLPIGFVHFTRRSRADWEWSIYLGEADSPRGAGTVLGMLALDHAFEEIGAERVLSSFYPDNTRALRMYSRLAFLSDDDEEDPNQLSGAADAPKLTSLVISRGDWLAHRVQLRRELDQGD